MQMETSVASVHHRRDINLRPSFAPFITPSLVDSQPKERPQILTDAMR